MLPILRERVMLPKGLRESGGLSQFFNDFWRDLEGEGGLERTGRIELDVYEDENHFNVEASLPGLKREDIHVDLENDILSITAQRDEKKEEHKGTYHLRERYVGSSSRSVRIPSNVDSEKVSASFKDGVLKITLEKVEQAKPRNIEVK